MEKAQVSVPLWGRQPTQRVPTIIEGLFVTVDGDRDVLFLASHVADGLQLDKTWVFRSGVMSNRTADEIAAVVGNVAYQMIGSFFRIKDDGQMVFPE